MRGSVSAWDAGAGSTRSPTIAVIGAEASSRPLITRFAAATSKCRGREPGLLQKFRKRARLDYLGELDAELGIRGHEQHEPPALALPQLHAADFSLDRPLAKP